MRSSCRALLISSSILSVDGKMKLVFPRNKFTEKINIDLLKCVTAAELIHFVVHFVEDQRTIVVDCVVFDDGVH